MLADVADCRREVLVSMATSAIAPAMAALVTNPADVAKTRLNMDRELQPANAPRRYRGILDCWRQTYSSEGVAGLQRGLGFVLVRESSKNAFRIGLYEPTVAVLQTCRGDSASVPAPIAVRVVAGMSTGALSALICNPLDLLKTRLQLEGSRETASVAMRQLVAAQGAWTLWRRGALANMCRSAMATGVALPVNARLKEAAQGTPAFVRRPALRDLCAALGSSAITAFVINPLDLIRTRLYANNAAYGGGGVLQCACRIATIEGPLAFWKGCGAAFLRIGPHQTLTLTLIGMLRRVEARYSLGT